jgi:clan AA aspartic protease
MELNDRPYSGMGEVRVKVRITNSADAQAAQAGKLAPDKVRSIESDALVDTGAVRSCVPAPLLERIGISAYEHRIVEYADGRKDSVGIADGIRFEIMHRKSSDDALMLGDEVLIGQTLLEKMDLLVDCARQRLVPNPAHPDVEVSKVK